MRTSLRAVVTRTVRARIGKPFRPREGVSLVLLGAVVGSVLLAQPWRRAKPTPVLSAFLSTAPEDFAPEPDPVTPDSAPRRSPPRPADREPVDYNRHVRPILAEFCFACHGPADDGRKADLRLDTRDGATQLSSAGSPVVAPHDSARSELLARVAAGTMPPPSFGKKPSAAQVETLRRWVEEGAKYTPHWAYARPVAAALPTTKTRGWVRNPIDSFVLARLEHEGLAPTPEADRATLLRRISLDLTGLPPTPAEVDAFVNDSAADAYECAVERLLASPHYGERMASAWLDLARYADTNGGTVDTAREMAAYRDWVIRAFNDNLPFDQFTTEQLAGDLLPTPTLAQKIGTGFLRNEAVQLEVCKAQSGPAILIDRVNTVSTVWLGLTAACAQCHDHKFDPLTQRQYFQMMAFFNTHLKGEKWFHSIDPRGNVTPTVALPSNTQTARLADVKARVTVVERDFARLFAAALVPAPTPAAPARGDVVRLHAERERLAKEEADIWGETASAMVMDQPPAAERADTHVLVRGEFTRKGAVVTAAVPGFLPPLPHGAPPDRLGFARWLASPAHPLTGRVAVNRIWQGHFGTGLVATPDDFGTQGDAPSHPGLLDWLALRFVEGGRGLQGEPAGGSPSNGAWDVKQMHRLIVCSATYRQGGRVTPELRDTDPGNRLLARWPRRRLPAETIRDNALAVSGLLDRRLGGPAVRPYQPPGLWESVSDQTHPSAHTYVQSRGRDLYRRGVYLYVKRTMPHPSMTIFDAPSRDACSVRRHTTNTALQALALLNDTAAVECARGTAVRMLREGGGTTDDWLTYGFRLCTARAPRPPELAALRRVYEAEVARFQADPAAAAALLAVGEMLNPRDVPPAVMAALTVVANVLLNLDETITLE